jgi:hypothetical protein
MTPKRPRTRKAPRPRALQSKHVGVTREESARLIATLNERAKFMDALRHDLDIQFKRIAHIQAELDDLRRLVTKIAAA